MLIYTVEFSMPNGFLLVELCNFSLIYSRDALACDALKFSFCPTLLLKRSIFVEVSKPSMIY